jgi:hypothetical protein
MVFCYDTRSVIVCPFRDRTIPIICVYIIVLNCGAITCIINNFIRPVIRHGSEP